MYLELHRINKIRPFIRIQAANKPVAAFLLVRLDYGNPLLAGLSDDAHKELHRFQKNAARLVLKLSKHVHLNFLLRSLHWLIVKARERYKVAILCYQHSTTQKHRIDRLCFLG